VASAETALRGGQAPERLVPVDLRQPIGDAVMRFVVE
jgi:hypothetical protein